MELADIRSYLDNKSIVVVGNSPHVLQYDNGDIIDSHEVIIRLNKFNLGEEYEKHTGIFTDVFGTCYWNKVLPDVNYILEKGVDFVISSIPKKECKYFSQKEIDNNIEKSKKLGYESLLNKTFWIPGEFIDEIGDKIGIGKRPSTGTIIACWILSVIKFRSFFCTGISFGEFKLHYNQHDYKGVGPGKKHHDPYNERHAFKYVLDKINLDKVMFDSHMTKILKGLR